MREAEHLHMHGKVQRKGQFPMQMSEILILFNTSQLVSIRPKRTGYKYTAVSSIP